MSWPTQRGGPWGKRAAGALERAARVASDPRLRAARLIGAMLARMMEDYMRAQERTKTGPAPDFIMARRGTTIPEGFDIPGHWVQNCTSPIQIGANTGPWAGGGCSANPGVSHSFSTVAPTAGSSNVWFGDRCHVDFGPPITHTANPTAGAWHRNAAFDRIAAHPDPMNPTYPQWRDLVLNPPLPIARPDVAAPPEANANPDALRPGVSAPPMPIPRPVALTPRARALRAVWARSVALGIPGARSEAGQPSRPIAVPGAIAPGAVVPQRPAIPAVGPQFEWTAQGLRRLAASRAPAIPQARVAANTVEVKAQVQSGGFVASFISSLTEAADTIDCFHNALPANNLSALPGDERRAALKRAGQRYRDEAAYAKRNDAWGNSSYREARAEYRRLRANPRTTGASRVQKMHDVFDYLKSASDEAAAEFLCRTFRCMGAEQIEDAAFGALGSAAVEHARALNMPATVQRGGWLYRHYQRQNATAGPRVSAAPSPISAQSICG